MRVHVDIVSDTVCPWCFVGKRRFEAAVAALRAGGRPDLEVAVRWRPFFLDPTLPREGVDKLAHYRRKFGEERMAQMIPYMRAVGAKESPPIAFSYGGRIGNTLDSHRLLALAYEQGGAALQGELVEALFRAYFEAERDVGSRDVLADAAAAAGMDRAAVAAFLASDAKADDVKAEVEAFRRKHRVSGVPFFVLNGRLTLSGAQDVETFVDALQEAAQQSA
jgi:predicted DsbA family dithiol-disulfide isomerase